MSELLYIKYNSHRRPEYQLSTRIVSKDYTKKVIKKPLTKAAEKHITTIKKNYKKLDGYYKNIKPIPYKEVNDGLEFDFICGESLLKGINFEKDSIESICSKLIKVMDEIFDINEEYLCDFEETEDFQIIFPDKHPTGKALKTCNLDSIFDNFVKTADGTFCIDYEWVLDFPVPINFVKYRMMHYLYEEKESYLKCKTSFSEFVDCLGITDNEKNLYADMEMDFQYLVHGQNVEYIYLERYKKRMATPEQLYRQIDVKDEHIANLEKNLESRDELIKNLTEEKDRVREELDEHSKLLEEHIEKIKEQSEILGKIRRGLKNPFYGIYLAGSYTGSRIKNFIEYRKAVYNVKHEQKRLEKKVELDKLRYEELDKLANGDYESWIQRREAEYKSGEFFEYKPLISVVVPVYNVEDRHLKPCIDSVKAQTYDNWELILVDDCSDYDNVKKTLKWKSLLNKKIQVIYRDENGGISACTNTGLEAANGEYIAFLDCDDTFAPFALYEVVKKLNEGDYDFIYSDEDKITDDGTKRWDPFFKPDWSPDTLMSFMYTSHLGVYKTSIIKDLEGLRSEYDGCQDYDLTLRFTEKTDKIGHIPKILYHWREREESTASDPEKKSYIKEKARICKEDAIERRGLKADLEWLDDIYQYRVSYVPQNKPLVSVIIPSKDNPGLLEQCIGTVNEKTAYKNYEIIVVDNGSSDANRELYQRICGKYKCRYHYEEMDFNFSYMCNTGARMAKGEYLLFLNDDIEVTDSRWLDRMLGHAQLPHIGAVGAKLLYPNTTLIQHDGVISIESGPVHEFAKMDDKGWCYYNRNLLEYNVSSVTAACMLVNKDKFEDIGGFDENLAVAYNDIDLCFRFLKSGYYNVVRNDAVLYHHESISRGDDALDPEKFARLMDEQEKLYTKHPEYRKKDPFYNRNLTQTECDFSNNYELDYDYSIRTIEKDELSSIETDDTIRYGIDIARNDWCTYIEGWAFKEGFDDNINLETKILLEGENKSYIINTAHVLREDVVKTFPDENCISFCGFKTRVNRGRISPGNYTVRVLSNECIAGIENINPESKDTITI